MRVPARPAVVVLALVLLGGCASAPEDGEPGSEVPPIAAPEPAVATEPAAPGEPVTPSPPVTPVEPVVRGEPVPGDEAPPPSAAPPPPSSPDRLSETPSAPPPPVPAPAKTAEFDPLQRMRDEQKAQVDRQLAQDKARERMTAAQANIATLEARLLPIRNPFLPRPQVPPEEAKAWEGLDGAERVKRVEDQLAVARLELEAARKAYADLGGRLD